MRVAFIHQDKKLHTGAHYINDIMSRALRKHGVRVKHFYPKSPLIDAPHHLKGLNNILFFHSLLEHKDEILKCDVIQGTTYTPLAFLPFDIPVISHCGSTTRGFLRSVPRTHHIEEALRAIWQELHDKKIITELNIKTRRPLRDIAEIETLVAQRADAVIASSYVVAEELAAKKVDRTKIHTIHNAIEDLWFEHKPTGTCQPSLVYLGRLGNDVFTLKLKGLDRLIWVYRKFKHTPKATFAITTNRQLTDWLTSSLPLHQTHANLLKEELLLYFRKLRGSILLVPSRYEGFCLSLIEGMSQGLVPVAFPVGIVPEIIINGENGFIVTSVEEMERATRTLLDNEELRIKMAHQAHKTALQFHPDVIAGKLIELYRSFA